MHVKAQKKFDTAGVGLKESSARAQDWTLDMCKFSGILKGLEEVVNTAAAATDDGGDADPPVKPKKTKKRKKASTADTEHGSSAADVARASAKAASTAPDAPKAADTIPSAHAARYAKRARNKLVKGYSQTDLAAILGQTALFGASPSQLCMRHAQSWPTMCALVLSKNIRASVIHLRSQQSGCLRR